jgi:hypothetical protein
MGRCRHMGEFPFGTGGGEGGCQEGAVLGRLRAAKTVCELG